MILITQHDLCYRYAKFVKGESHLNDEELMEYNVIRCQADELLTDDDDEDY
jgi:hypothetical protein